MNFLSDLEVIIKKAVNESLEADERLLQKKQSDRVEKESSESYDIDMYKLTPLIIDNNGPEEDLEQQVKNTWQLATKSCKKYLMK